MNRQPATGQALVADFQTALVSTATVQAAQNEASRSENELMQHLEAISAGTYLNPGALAPADQDTLTRASLDAHIKKVQTEQLNAMGTAQLQQLVAQDRELYKGRKVTVKVLSGAPQQIDIVWFDQQNGYRTSSAKKKMIRGVIDDVMLDRNVMVLRPTWKQQLLNGRLKNYLVYIIDPANFQPMVEIQID